MANRIKSKKKGPKDPKYSTCKNIPPTKPIKKMIMDAASVTNTKAEVYFSVP